MPLEGVQHILFKKNNAVKLKAKQGFISAHLGFFNLKVAAALKY